MTTTDTPLELLGAHPGISVIDTSSVLTRLWYFDGRFLRAEGFRLDQQYVRSLVALSNQAVGHGVVHGFDVARGGGPGSTAGDVLRISAGLALAPSGRVIHLPAEVELAVATLIARSSGEFDPGQASTAGTADFAPCPPDTPADPVTTVPPRPVYVLTVAAAEALCGEEESFGQLCEDACATETNRSTAVEGARFRVRELQLALPNSTRVAFDDSHLRSRVATAYFERERTAVPPLISGAGLRSTVWCRGAAGIGGEEVPLAVFGRTGSGALWSDTWVARRELVETTPQRHWAWRLAMRPLDVFLAQVLQFQCQLAEAPTTGGGGGGPVEDPCAGERSVLAEADEVLQGLLAEPVGEVTRRLEQLRAKIAGALSTPVRTASGSLLIDWGHATIPPGGYLPIDRNRPVEPQLQALMGPGVDLRFCAVRADFVPEALQEAQHMERISLTQGIDDPDRLEEVDVLVPGGQRSEAGTTIEAFEGVVRVLPATRRDDDGTTSGSVLTFTAVARDHVRPGWSWSLAAHTEAPQRLAVGRVARAFFAAPAGEEAGGEEAELHVEADTAHDAALAGAAFRQRVNREATWARERAERVSRRIFTGEEPGAVADRPVARDERRPMALWFDAEADRDLRELAVGDRAAARLRLTAYSRASDEPSLVDIQVTGPLVVRSSQASTSGGMAVADVLTELEGAMDRLLITGGQVDDPPPRPLRVGLRWRIAVTPVGARILSVGLEPSDNSLVAAFQDRGDPRQVLGRLTAKRAPVPTTHLSAGWSSVRAAGEGSELATLQLDESPRALDIGTRGRDLAEAVISVIGTELAARGRDDGFAASARRRLFDSDAGGTSTITPTSDWVLFHRRRTKACAGVAERPVAIRHLQWFHALLQADDDLSRFTALVGAWREATAGGGGDAGLAARIDQLGFQPVAIVEFPEGSPQLASSRPALRSAWRTRDRGDSLVAGVVASPPASDGVHVDLARFTTATSLVADLVDLSRMQTSTIAEIPPEFRSPGIDGAFFTVGADRPVIRSIHALLVREPDERFTVGNRDLEPLTRDVLEELLGDAFDVLVAHFDGTALTNRDEVIKWWGGRPVKQASYATTRDFARGENASEVEQCVASLLDSLGRAPVAREPSTVWSDDETQFVVGLVAGMVPQ